MTNIKKYFGLIGFQIITFIGLLVASEALKDNITAKLCGAIAFASGLCAVEEWKTLSRQKQPKLQTGDIISYLNEKQIMVIATVIATGDEILVQNITVNCRMTRITQNQIKTVYKRQEDIRG